MDNLKSSDLIIKIKEMVNARVFISCGQKDDEEANFADKLSSKLLQMDFEPYVAISEQTLRGVKENIFRLIEQSEYFIFVDFKREKLEDSGVDSDSEQSYRGSLFSNQELAIATFLDKDVLAFQEDGVKKRDGIIGSVQLNTVPFTESSRRLLPGFIADKVRENKWDAHWRNELFIERQDPKEHVPAMSYAAKKIVARDNEDSGPQDVDRKKPARYYHITVRNSHRQKPALSCVAYLEGYSNRSTAQEYSFLEPVELKWKGLRAREVDIQPQHYKHLDAMYVIDDSQDTVHFGINPFLIDYSGFLDEYTLKGPGNFELTFDIYSLNFLSVKTKFNLQIGRSYDDISLRKIEEQKMAR